MAPARGPPAGPGRARRGAGPRGSGPGGGGGGRGPRPPPASGPRRGRTGAVRAGVREFAADELVAEFNLSWQAAAEQIAYACAVAERLPRTFAALAAGQIHPVHVKIIEDETRVLSPQDAARAVEGLAGAAGARSFGQVPSAAHRLGPKLEPAPAPR